MEEQVTKGFTLQTRREWTTIPVKYPRPRNNAPHRVNSSELGLNANRANAKPGIPFPPSRTSVDLVEAYAQPHRGLLFSLGMQAADFSDRGDYGAIKLPRHAMISVARTRD